MAENKNVPMKADDEPVHWLVRPASIRNLWIVGIAVLAATVLIELVYNMHGYFGADEIFGFNAWYGLLACAAMVVGAKMLGNFLKRPDDYYDD